MYNLGFNYGKKIRTTQNKISIQVKILFRSPVLSGSEQCRQCKD